MGLVVEYDNFRAALRSFSDANDGEGCLHLIGALSHDWLSYGYAFDPAAWIDLILRHEGEVSPTTRGLALMGAGLMSFMEATVRLRSRRSAKVLRPIVSLATSSA